MIKSIKYKILLIFFIIGVLPLAGFIIWEYNQSIERLSQRSFEQLKTVRQIKKTELEWYFSKIQTETSLFAQSNFAVNAMKEFKQAFFDMENVTVPSEYRNDLLNLYQEELITIPEFEKEHEPKMEELVPSEERSVLLQHQYLMSTKANSAKLPYFDVHNKFHKSLSDFIKRYDIYDLFLVEDDTGHIVYSVVKEIDYATSLLSGPYADTNIGKLFRKIRYTGLKNETIMCDYERYLPSNFAPAAFISAPIFDHEIKVGTLILQVPLDKINQITTGTKAWKEEGLGKSGETYIVGKDYRMRTDSRFIIESSQEYLKGIEKSGTASEEEMALMDYYKTSVLFQKAHTKPVDKAIAGNSGTMTALDYRNIEVLSSYSPLKIDNMSWALMAEIDTEEIFQSVQKGARKSSIVLAIVLMLAFLASVLLARTIYKPIRMLARASSDLGDGNFDTRVVIKNKDELGLLADNFNQSISKLKEGRQEIVAKNKLLNRQKDELANKSKNLLTLNNQISELNKSLDKKVKERTIRLELQNKKLLAYADFNSHQLRSPVSTILGLLDVLKVSGTEKDRDEYLSLLDASANQLDRVIHKAQELLEATDLKD